MENRESQGKIFLMKKSGKFVKNCQSQGNGFVLANVLENVNIVYLISIFCQSIRVIIVTFSYTDDKLVLRKNISSQGKVSENKNLKIVAIL